MKNEDKGGEVEILLVEDNAEDVELTLRALRKDHMTNQIHVARDGEEALAFLFQDRPDHPHLRLVLLDLKLPKVDGLEVLKKLKSDPRTKGLPVVVMTSSREDRDLVTSHGLGVNGYLQKPLDVNQFRALVKAMGFYWVLIHQQPSAASPGGRAWAGAGEVYGQ
jgi:CheY-like chemotaxis protein